MTYVNFSGIDRNNLGWGDILWEGGGRGAG